MSHPPPADSGPSALSFSFEGLGEKEQVLFKSFVRLLTHRTLHRWSHKAAGGDLRVVPLGHPAAASGPALVLGPAPARPPHHLSLPIHADELETVLNRLGIQLAQRRDPARSGAVQPGERLRLLRWPSAALLTTRERVRLATLMTGRPLSLADVQRRSGVAEAVCSDFVSDLDRAGVLERDLPTVPAALEERPRIAAAASPGLLARIRSRLGLASTSRP